MKKVLVIISGFAIVAVGAYFLLKTDKQVTGGGAVYSKAELGLEFSYKSGPNGYVLEERIPADLGELVRVIILHRTEDTLKTPPVGGEGPAVMTISIFNNTKKLSSSVWADKNIQYSNINLKQGEVSETVVGGANAVRYMSDGLYPSENVVVAHGENIYVFTGQFMDADSDLRRDFAPLVESIKFIPKDTQIGGSRDSKGCLIPAGYSFDEEVGACIRAFDMTPDIMKAAKIAVDSVGKSYALTVISFNSYEEVGAYDIMLEKGEEREKMTVYIRGGKVVSKPE